MAGSDMPKIPVAKHGTHSVFSLEFLVFKKTPSTAPNVANGVPSIKARSGSKPNWAIVIKLIGINPQCRPNMTNTCHNPPINKPASVGFKSYAPLAKKPNIAPNQVAAGPIIKKVSGTIIIRVAKGTINI
ncbi:hypothetical protein HMSSN036_07590 [Paenibacillus macerans]|nr:hypothetical protein HMSSN036_07590 [Paenibacillus macerans]